MPPCEAAVKAGIVTNLPVFIVPATTQEPIDSRYSTEADVTNALNAQRHDDTKTRFTTAASSPMQIKIELLSALAKGKPLLILVVSEDNRVSALGRNIVAAVDMLSPAQKEKCHLLTHGWMMAEGLITTKAIQCAEQGKTVEETIAICGQLADKNLMCRLSFNDCQDPVVSEC